MDHITFSNEKTPFFPQAPNESLLKDLEPSKRIQIKKIILITSIIFFSAVGIFSIYDGARTISAGLPLKTKDLVFSICEIAFGFFVAMTFCGTAGACIGSYQTNAESYPHHNAYQGSLTDFVSLANSHFFFDEFGVDTWKSFVSRSLNRLDPIVLDKYFLLKKVDPEKLVEHLCEALQKGCCFGYTMELLGSMKKNAKLPSNKLKESIKIENVVQYQLVNIILCPLLNSTKLFRFCKLLRSCPLLNYNYVFNDSCFLDNFENIKNQKDELLIQFQKAESDICDQNKQEMTLAGYIQMGLTELDEPRAGHALFFQISDGYFRFRDSASILNHFFEFETKESMIEGLVSHIRTVYGKYKDIKLEIILLGIPHTETI